MYGISLWFLRHRSFVPLLQLNLKKSSLTYLTSSLDNKYHYFQSSVGPDSAILRWSAIGTHYTWMDTTSAVLELDSWQSFFGYFTFISILAIIIRYKAKVAHVYFAELMQSWALWVSDERDESITSAGSVEMSALLDPAHWLTVCLCHPPLSPSSSWSHQRARVQPAVWRLEHRSHHVPAVRSHTYLPSHTVTPYMSWTKIRLLFFSVSHTHTHIQQSCTIRLQRHVSHDRVHHTL